MQNLRTQGEARRFELNSAPATSQPGDRAGYRVPIAAAEVLA